MSSNEQNIKFTGNESEYVTELRGQVVSVQCGDGNHNHGSSKVKLTDRIDYNWEFKYYHGHLVAAHIHGKIIAYAMKGKDGGMIRVVHQDTTGKRALIKNLKEDIKDLSFAFSNPEVILACVDCEGNIFVYNIEDSPDSLTYTLLLHVIHKEPIRSKTNLRLAWCPWMPGNDEDLDFCGSEKIFVVLNGNKAEIFNVSMLNSKYGTEGPIYANTSYEGYREIIHTSELVDASFASDGCAIALACQDGYVKFFQLIMFDPDLQKCLYEWIPHEDKTLTSVIFVDNILEYISHCWKFAITGANNNTELKLWSCETWSCLQTINFLPNPKSLIPDLFLNVAADYSGKYLVVSDINNRGIYVLELQKNQEEQLICAALMSYFRVPAPFLSFHILETGTRNVPFCYNNSAEDLYDNEDDYDDEALICVQHVKMLVIQPKKFQECNITFQLESRMYGDAVVTETVDDLVDLKNGEIEEESETVEEKIPKLDDLQSTVTLLIQQQQHNNSKLTLMTPDDFTSSGKVSKSSSVRNSITNENILTESIEKTNDGSETDFQRPQKDNFASAGSSPSREVQEILSLTNSSSGYPTQEYYTNLANLQVQDKEERPQKDYSVPPEGAMLYPNLENWSLVKDPEAMKLFKEVNTNGITKQDLEDVYLRMTGLENMIREQTAVLQQIQQDLKGLNQDDNLITAMGQILSKTMSEKVTQIVQYEIKHALLPSLHNMVGSYTLHVETEYNLKFANLEAMVKDHFAKALNSEALVDVMNTSFTNSIVPYLEKSYRDVIVRSLVPSWEKVCAQMFQQINEAFAKGTKEYTLSVETYMDKQRRVQDKERNVVLQMQSDLKTTSDKLMETLSTDINKQLSTIFKNVQDKLIHNMKEVVGQELKQGFRSQARLIEEGVLNAVSRSRAVTPAPHADTQMQTIAHIQQAIAKHTYDEAFQFALSAENLNLVIFVCERVDVNKVFGEQCLLNQSVLLALIQQLSMELQKNTDIKLSFIRAAFLALTPKVPETKQFIPKVLGDLIKQLTSFTQSNSPVKQKTDAQLLKMAVESIYSQLSNE